jgi:antitoxin ParD1/3/4
MAVLVSGWNYCYLSVKKYRPMAHAKQLTISLTPEMATVVEEAVDSGEYASSSEVVKEALREWEQRRARQRQEVEALSRLWDTGLSGGPSDLPDIQVLAAEARRRF